MPYLNVSKAFEEYGSLLGMLAASDDVSKALAERENF
jgi:hypothetical protein